MRQGDIKIFIGTNGTGKTTTMKKYMAVNERNLIIPSGRNDIAWQGIEELTYKPTMINDPRYPPEMNKKIPAIRIPELNTFTGNRVLHVDGRPELFKAVCDHVHGYRNGGLFMDDFRNYVFTKGTLSHEVDSLFKNRRHKMLDIYMACHSFQDISADFIRFGPQLIIHYTTLPINKSVEARMHNADKLREVVDRVNSINAQQPEGQRFYKEPFHLVE